MRIIGGRRLWETAALSMRISLCFLGPANGILQKPEDERDWRKLEQLKCAVIDLAEGRECVVILGEATVDAIVASLSVEQLGEPGFSTCSVAVAIADPHSPWVTLIPAGAKLDLAAPHRDVCAQEDVRSFYIDAVKAAAARSDKRLWFRTRPFGPPCASPLADASRNLVRAKEGELQALARRKGMSPKELFDQMALFLWDTLFFDACVRWTEDGVANLDAARTHSLAKWFVHGQQLAAKPLHDGICAFCGALLHGETGNHGTSNKIAGPPVDKHGERRFS